MMIINPQIVIRRRKDSLLARIMKTPPFIVTLEAGVESESETTRYSFTKTFETIHCRNEEEIQIAVNEASKKITWDRKMMVLDLTHEFPNVKISDSCAFVWEKN